MDLYTFLCLWTFSYFLFSFFIIRKIMVKFIQQKTKFPIKTKREHCKKIHSDLFPNTIRALICGPSGCGKTVMLYNLIAHTKGLKFSNLYVISQSLGQEKYRNLNEIFKYLDEDVKLCTSSICEITPNDVENDSIIVFDDIKRDKICDKKTNYFSPWGVIRDYLASICVKLTVKYLNNL